MRTQYRIDEDTIWEDTGRIYCLRDNMFCRIYWEMKRGQIGRKEIIGPFIIVEELPTEMQALCSIMYHAQKALYGAMPLHDFIAKNKII